MPFENREHAARLLAEKMSRYRGKHPLILGIPRGGVVMAGVIAEALEGEVDVVLVHKLGAPGQPEFAIGSVDEGGRVYLGGAADRLGIARGYIEQETRRQLDLMRRRRAQYTPVRPPISARGRIAVIVDDGLATGATMVAALHAVRAQKPSRLVAATGVAPAETLERIESLADDVVCLEAPAVFFAVGQFFRDFEQVEDDEVITVLKQHGPRGEPG